MALANLVINGYNLLIHVNLATRYKVNLMPSLRYRYLLIAVLALLLLAGCQQKKFTPYPTPVTKESATGVSPAVIVIPTINPQNHIGLLEEDMDEKQQLSQNLAVNDPLLQKLTTDPQTGTSLRASVFGAYPARESDITSESEACRNHSCYRVDIYNWATNTTYVVMVDIQTQTVINVDAMPATSPELPPRLLKKAMTIAVQAPEVEEALGFKPEPDSPTMAGVKTTFNNTACERSHHLCVAPTFERDTKALWAIVDLTDEKLVAVRWTDYGDFSGSLPTEETIEREDIFERFCKQSTELQRDGWRMDFILTASDGLRLSDVSFEGQPVLRSVKLVDYHVSYSTQDQFGYSDAIGCPMFSSAAVVAMDPPDIGAIEQDGQEIGFYINQDFVHPLWPQPCNYRYNQRYEFYADGRFRVMAANLGRGCGHDAVYRFLYRIDFINESETFAQWDDGEWKMWEKENWYKEELTETPVSPEGYLYRIANEGGGGYYLEPNRSQFGDGSRGDNAYTYVVKHHPDEGDADMLTLGTCCHLDHQQGPEQFINDEAIINEDLVIWYVPVIENDDRPGHEYCWADRVPENGMYINKIWPCWSGPMFVPFQ